MKRIFLAILLASMSEAVLADGPYAALGLSRGEVASESSGGGRVALGYAPMESIAIEGGYNVLGRYNGIDVRGLDVGLLGTLPLSRGIGLTARAAALRYSLSRNGAKADDDGHVLGVGLSYGIARLEANRTYIHGDRIAIIMLTLTNPIR